MYTHRAWPALLAVAILLPAAATAAVQGESRNNSLGTVTSLQWTWGNPTPSGDKFTLLVQGNSLYVAAGEDGVIYTSPDGITWSPGSSVIGNGGTYLDAVFGGGQFVLAGVDASGGSHVTSSSDGIHWTDTPLKLGADASQMALSYGNGTFVAMGNASTATSNDGVHWTVHALNFSPRASSLNCINTVCIDLGFGNPGTSTMFYSTDDGVTWNKSDLQNASIVGVVNNNGGTFFLFDSVSDTGIYTSTDGSHWTKHTASGNVPNFSNAYWDGTRFLSVDIPAASTKVSLFSSSDGIAWTQGGVIASPSTQLYNILTGQHQVVTTGSGYVAAGLGALQIVQSADFTTWTLLSPVASGIAGAFSEVINAGGHYVAVGATPGSLPAVMQSADGVTWNSVFTGTMLTNLSTVAYGNGVYVAAGVANSSPNKLWMWLYSADASHWSMIKNPGPIVGDMAYGNGEFVAFVRECPSDCSATESATSKDGLTWVTHALPAAFTADKAYNNIGFNGDKFFTLGIAKAKNEGTVYVSNDGVTWTSGGSFSALSGTAFSRIRAFGAGFGAVGGYLMQCPADPSSCAGIGTDSVVATSTTGITWTVSMGGSGILGDGAFTDIAYTGHDYFAAYPQGSLAASTDGIHWCQISGFPLAVSSAMVINTSGFPVAASANTLVFNGSQLVVADGEGDILSTTLNPSQSGSSFVCESGTFGSVYTNSTGNGGNGGSGSPGSTTGGSGGGGGLELLTIAGLFGLAALRCRRSGRG